MSVKLFVLICVLWIEPLLVVLGSQLNNTEEVFHKVQTQNDEDIEKLFWFGCDRDVTSEYKRSLHKFSLKLYKRTADVHEGNFAVSEYSIWLALAALAEGAPISQQKSVLEFLQLPQERCLRDKYYDIATTRESPGNDVTSVRRRVLVLDGSLEPNKTWIKDVREAGLLDIVTMKFNKSNSLSELFDNFIKSDTANKVFADARIELKDKTISSEINHVSTNAFLLDYLDFNVTWTAAFPNSSIEKDASFYNDQGVEIGKVDLLKARRRVKFAFLPILNAKAMELPVGYNGRYRMLFIQNIGKKEIKDTINQIPDTMFLDITQYMHESLIPLDVAIPKFTINSVITVKKVIEQKGEIRAYNESGTTVSIENWVQKVNIKITEAGVPQDNDHQFEIVPSFATGVATALGRQFIANRPFIFHLLDSETRTCLFGGVFVHPAN